MSINSQVNSNTKLVANHATINLVRGICQRITQALQQIDNICTEQQHPKSDPSSLGQFEGLGIFLYVKSNQQALKKKFPAFTQNQILSILLAQWQKLSEIQKLSYTQKFNLKQYKDSKKLKKINKNASKIFQSVQKQNKAQMIKQISQNSDIKENCLQQKLSLCKKIAIQTNLNDFFDQNKQLVKKDEQKSDDNLNKYKSFEIRQQICLQLSNHSQQKQQELERIEQSHQKLPLLDMKIPDNSYQQQKLDSFNKNEEKQNPLIIQQQQIQNQCNIQKNSPKDQDIRSLNCPIDMSVIPALSQCIQSQLIQNQNLNKQLQNQTVIIIKQEIKQRNQPSIEENSQNSFSFGHKQAKNQQVLSKDQKLKLECFVDSQKAQKHDIQEQTPVFSSPQGIFETKGYIENNQN